MDEKWRQTLTRAGMDVDEALGRFMNLEEMLEKYLLRFPQDPNFSKLKRALEHRRSEEAYEAAHALKGVAGNLSMKRLFEAASGMVEQLRGDDLAGAADRLPELEQRYLEMLRAIGDHGQGASTTE